MKVLIIYCYLVVLVTSSVSLSYFRYRSIRKQPNDSGSYFHWFYYFYEKSTIKFFFFRWELIFIFYIYATDSNWYIKEIKITMFYFIVQMLLFIRFCLKEVLIIWNWYFKVMRTSCSQINLEIFFSWRKFVVAIFQAFLFHYLRCHTLTF